MRGRWVVAVLALPAMLTGCGPTASRPVAQATGTAATTRAPVGSRAAALTLATQMLSQLVVPTGMSWFGKGLAPGTTNTVTVLWVAYSLRSVASGLTKGELGTAALPLADGDTLIRADASVSWFPPRSAAEQLNAARFRAVTVTVTNFGPPQRMVTRTFTSLAVIGRLVALVDSLPATPDPDVFAMKCSGAITTAYQLTFIPGVVISPGGCGETDAITVNGEEQPLPWDPGVLTTAIRQLLHLPT